MQNKYVEVNLETETHKYICQGFSIYQERQQASVAELTLDEPVDENKNAIISIGSGSVLIRYLIVQILSCAQITEKKFILICVEVTRFLLDKPVKTTQALNSTLEDALELIMGELSLLVDFDGDSTHSKNLVFFGSVRNVLDQLRISFQLEKERWMINIFTKKFYFLKQGRLKKEFAFQKEGKERDVLTLFLDRAFDGGVELRQIIPQIRPYLGVTWNHQPWIVDRTEMKSPSNSPMKIFLVEDES